MRKIETIEELRSIMLAILDHIDEFCKKNNITYYICGGTLLGAIRHKGFIPWDDDIDIMMLREDYEKFINEYPSLDASCYRLYHYKYQKDYIYPFAKVGDTRTHTELKGEYNVGVYVDIFPIDNIPDDVRLQRKIFKRRKSLGRISGAHLLRRGYFDGARKKKTVLGGLLHFTLIKSLFGSLEESIRSVDENAKDANKYHPSTHKASLTCGYDEKEIMPNEIYKETIRVDFEGRKYSAPCGWDIYLRNIFGNYMQLPPEDQRHIHGFNAYWK